MQQRSHDRGPDCVRLMEEGVQIRQQVVSDCQNFPAGLGHTGPEAGVMVLQWKDTEQ